jgi:protein O-mannosyl-transferase
MHTPWVGNRYSVLIVIAFVGMVAYANTFSVPFQFDDDAYVVNNPVLRDFRSFLHPGEIASGISRSPTGVPPALRVAFTTRILGYLSLAINYHLHGLNVTGYHIVNLLIHILNAWLVYLILIQMFKGHFFSDDQTADAAPATMAFAGALFFLCHPIQTQAVTYITSRFVLLASFFSFLSVFACIRFPLSATRRHRRSWMIFSILALSAAMLTKEFTFAIPFIIGLYDFSFLPGTVREKLRALAPLALTLPIIPVLVFIRQGSIGALDSTMRAITAADVSQITRVDYLLTQFKAIALYLKLLVLPVGQNIDHDIPLQHSILDPAVLGSFLLLLGLLILVGYGYYRSYRTRGCPELKFISFGIFWFFIAISVESSIIPLGEVVAEYRLYLPSVGIIMAFISLGAVGIKRLSLNWKTFFACTAVLVMVLCGATVLRNRVWRSEISLWEDAAAKSPAKVRPHQNLGMYYSARGLLKQGLAELQRAVQIDPRSYELHNNLGVIYRQQGNFPAAVNEYREALRLEPEDPMAHYNLGNIYLSLGNLEEAIQEYQACARIAPDYDEVHNNLGIAYERNGQVEAAIAEFSKAIKLNPENVNAKKNLAETIRRAGRVR